VPAIQKHHLSHCLDIIRQTLMCQPSMGTITMEWVETQSKPSPDFDIQKKCINHSALLQWQSRNNIGSVQRWDEMIAPKGAYIHPASAELLAWEASL